MNESIKQNLEHIKTLINAQIDRAYTLTNNAETIDFANLDKIIIGCLAGDGIGPIIMDEAIKVANILLSKEIENKKIEFKIIDGLTLENRVEKMQTVPTEVLSEIKKCHVILKGPTTTPDKKDNLPNLESANVTLRKELDLFANVRPVTLPSQNIDWIFFRENTEGEYALGSQGIDISPEISMDFKVTTDVGTKRIARAAFSYAQANGNKKVSIITKANIMKKTDGRFLYICEEVAKEFPNVPYDHWYVDICAANLINPNINKDFNVFLLPNLYGDIITDEAAQIQGGVGTAGSANIGSKYAMFEAIHGSAPRMIKDGIGNYASPESIIKALEMLLRHIGYVDKADLLEKVCLEASRTLNMSGNISGNTAKEYGDLVSKLITEL